MSSIYERRPGDFESHAAVGAYNALYDRPTMLSLIGDVDGRLILDADCGPASTRRSCWPAERMCSRSTAARA